ncbi:relaxase/mobilization nuclease domain-containing protein, partial [Pseudomonas sp. Kh7]|uniref:relaxase/mobilization nuclease domain-containing protein n=1 Tax=Pseudomonas sp. Kh7 TaxID=2093743 RepID=UPI0015B51BA3
SALNCSVETAEEEMVLTKKRFNKTGGILGFHAFQSFKEGEVSPEIAHEIGVKLAEEMWGDRFEVVISTHLNTKHYHNHFVINSVSFL